MDRLLRALSMTRLQVDPRSSLGIMLEKIDASFLDFKQIRCVTLLTLPARGIIPMPHTHRAIESHARGMIVAHGRGVAPCERGGY